MITISYRLSIDNYRFEKNETLANSKVESGILGMLNSNYSRNFLQSLSSSHSQSKSQLFFLSFSQLLNKAVKDLLSVNQTEVSELYMCIYLCNFCALIFLIHSVSLIYSTRYLKLSFLTHSTQPLLLHQQTHSITYDMHTNCVCLCVYACVFR